MVMIKRNLNFEPCDLHKSEAVPPVAKLLRFDAHNSDVAHVMYGPTYNRTEDHISQLDQIGLVNFILF